MDVLVIGQEADAYVAGLRRALPEASLLAAATSGEGVKLAADAGAIIALAHEISDDLIAAAPKLRWIQALTTGVDHLSTLKNLRPDVLITCGKGIHGPQMSELAFFMMIALARNARAMMRNQDRGVWERWPQKLLLGKTAALVGVGAISEDLAKRCRAFGMRVIGVSSGRTEAEGFDGIFPRARLNDAAAEADFLIALVPYGPDTHHMIDGDTFARMRPHAIFINLARGGVVHEPSLIEALREGRIAGAGLDVFAAEPLPPASPLWSMDNVIVTPHIGGMSDVYVEQILPLVIDNARAFLRDRPGDMRNVVRR